VGTIYAFRVCLVLVKSGEHVLNFVFDSGPESSVEARPKTIWPWTSIFVHLMEGIENFLMGERFIEMSMLCYLMGVKVLYIKIPRGCGTCAKEIFEEVGENLHF
jgi:hypothetical protein